LHVEEPVTLPLEVESSQVTISGIVDLVHVTSDQVAILDYKTDSTRHAQPEYRKQLSVYYHVLSKWFTDKDVTMSLFYTTDGTQEQIEPLTVEELRSLIRENGTERWKATDSVGDNT